MNFVYFTFNNLNNLIILNLYFNIIIAIMLNYNQLLFISFKLFDKIKDKA